jgi:hypothetical protein
VRLTSKEPEKTFHEMLVRIEDSLSDLASSNDGDLREYKHDEETDHGKLSKHDEPSWVMGTISNMVQQHMERFWQKKM